MCVNLIIQVFFFRKIFPFQTYLLFPINNPSIFINSTIKYVFCLKWWMYSDSQHHKTKCQTSWKFPLTGICDLGGEEDWNLWPVLRARAILETDKKRNVLVFKTWGNTHFVKCSVFHSNICLNNVSFFFFPLNNSLPKPNILQQSYRNYWHLMNKVRSLI